MPKLFKIILFSLAPALVLVASGVSVVRSQEIDRELLERLQQARPIQPGTQRSPLDRARQAPTPRQERLPLLPKEIDQLEKPSALEKDYRARLDQPVAPAHRRFLTREGQTILIKDEDFESIEQFGYEIFDSRMPGVRSGVGRIPDTYILGIGDQIVVTLVGAKNDVNITFIDREGRFVVPDLPPIPAAGLSFGQFRNAVKQLAAQSMIGTEIFVSVASVRQIAVYVMGEVEKPGMYNLTALSSLFEALATAGGVKKSGSLRNISVVQDGKTTKIDLYEFMLSGGLADMKISDGARILVPVIGMTSAVSGSVLRPAIYEYPPDGSGLTMQRLLDLAGGAVRPRGNRISLNRIAKTGGINVSSVGDLSLEAWDGDAIEVTPISNYQGGKVYLSGHVSVSGARSLDAVQTLSGLISGVEDLGTTPYLSFAVLETTDPVARSRVMKAIDLHMILQGVEDIALQENDHLYVFGIDEIRYMSSPEVVNAVLKGKVETDACEAARNLTVIVKQDKDRRFEVVKRTFFGVMPEETLIDELANQPVESKLVDQQELLFAEEDHYCTELFELKPDLLVFALEHGASLGGGVQYPGIYPVAGTSTLSALLVAAGGALPNADLTRIEVTLPQKSSTRGGLLSERNIVDATQNEFKKLTAVAGASIRFHILPTNHEPGGVLLTGEFERPGFYSLLKGETMVDIVARAGGLTVQAYPYGAVMTRLSVQKEQQEGFRRAAREINSALASAAIKADLPGDVTTSVRQLSQDLASVEAIGRLVIEADPAVLRARPELNVLMEPGDRLHMPKRPQFVVVSGDVLNPSALQFVAGKNVKQYLKESGGLSFTADEDRVFLVYPNGEARPISLAPWSFKAAAVPPGSTIVVPKDLSPFTTLEFIRDVTGIFAQLALAAASLVIIADR